MLLGAQQLGVLVSFDRDVWGSDVVNIGDSEGVSEGSQKARVGLPAMFSQLSADGPGEFVTC